MEFLGRIQCRTMSSVPEARTSLLDSPSDFDSIGAIATELTLGLKITWAVFVFVWIIGAFTSKQTVRRQSLTSRFGMGAIAIGEYWLLFWTAKHFGFAYRRFLPESIVGLWVGLLMTIAGVIFAIWARVTLGRNWSGIITVKQNHELVRTGPYALARHPIYTGVTFALIGTAVFFGEIRTLILVIAALSVFIHKLKIEEQFMGQQFGPDYARYQEETKTLVPFIW